MDKNYYTVYIDDNGMQKQKAIICQCLGRVDTRVYGKAPIFREIITDTIIRPKYDIVIEKSANEILGTLVYDNININSYSKIATKEVLETLKSFNESSMESYIKTIKEVETKQIESALIRVRREDICYM